MAVGLLSGDALETATVVGELRLPRVGYDDEYRPLAGSYGGALRCGATMRAIGAEDPAPCRRRFLRYESRAGASADECREARRLMDWDASGGAPARRAALAWRGFPATARAGVYADEARRRRGTSPKGGSLSTFLARTVPRPTSPAPESEASLERWAGAVDDLLRARPRPGTTLEPRSLDAPGAADLARATRLDGLVVALVSRLPLETSGRRGETLRCVVDAVADWCATDDDAVELGAALAPAFEAAEPGGGALPLGLGAARVDVFLAAALAFAPPHARVRVVDVALCGPPGALAAVADAFYATVDVGGADRRDVLWAVADGAATFYDADAVFEAAAEAHADRAVDAAAPDDASSSSDDGAPVDYDAVDTTMDIEKMIADAKRKCHIQDHPRTPRPPTPPAPPAKKAASPLGAKIANFFHRPARARSAPDRAAAAAADDEPPRRRSESDAVGDGEGRRDAAAAAAADAGAALRERGELLEGLEGKAGDLADAAREYREHARRERQRVEEQRNKRWSLFGGRK